MVTVDDEKVVVPLSRLGFERTHRSVPITQDGSDCPQPISLQSVVSINDNTGAGKIIQIAKQSTGDILFLNMMSGNEVGIKAVPAKKVHCTDKGPIIMKNIKAKGDLLQGQKVRLSDPSHLGLEGTCRGFTED